MEVPCLHPHIKFHRCDFKSVGLQTQNLQNSYFFGINLPKICVYPLSDFFAKFGVGRESHVRTLAPNFTIFMALKCGLTVPEITKMVIFGINFPLMENHVVIDHCFTGSAVALHCVKAHRQSQWRSPNFNPL